MRVGELSSAINQEVQLLRTHHCQESNNLCESHQSFQILLDDGSTVLVKVAMQLNRSSFYIKAWATVTPDRDDVIGAIRGSFTNVTRMNKLFINNLPYTIGAHVVTQLEVALYEAMTLVNNQSTHF